MATEDKAKQIMTTKGNGDVSQLTVKELDILLAWHNVKKISNMCRDDKVKKWNAIQQKGIEPPAVKHWTDEDEMELIDASRTDLEIGDTAVGRLEKKRMKDFIQLAKKMSTEEWEEIENARREDDTNDGDNEGGI